MHTLLAFLFILIAFGAALLPTTLIVAWAIYRRRMDIRRSPLTTDPHHLPGEQAANAAEKIKDRANGRLLFAVLLGPVTLAIWSFQHADPHLLSFGSAELILLLVVAAGSAWSARSGVKFLLASRAYLDGLAAERATAQELIPLMSMGCAIYHDVPGNKFNLDHVVVGPGKVFMVETKSRRKPGKTGAANSRVTFDGKVLTFPDWCDSKTLDQARGQANWLSEYLYHKTGVRVPVEPVVALPGWFVTCTVQNPDIHVINPQMYKFMANTDGQSISDPQRRRIMTAVEECYRLTTVPTSPGGGHG